MTIDFTDRADLSRLDSSNGAFGRYDVFELIPDFVSIKGYSLSTTEGLNNTLFVEKTTSGGARVEVLVDQSVSPFDVNTYLEGDIAVDLLLADIELGSISISGDRLEITIGLRAPLKIALTLALLYD